ncbi:MAG TPA: FGGY family carbohydrate kinase [Roseiflexaceae bacterium]|nr:FGGY family carbohydrate kinase [Roseiflexaceae bacterium]
MTYVLGIDQGSSGSRAMLLDGAGAVVGYGYSPVARLYPRPGWVEQEPAAIAASVRGAVAKALEQARIAPDKVAACGITSQRDTVFAWDAASGAPIGNAITWQDLRTTALVAETAAWRHADERRVRLGHFPGAYSSAMHIVWRMRHDPAFAHAAAEGRLRLSLSAGWIVQALGKVHDHALDFSLMQGMAVLDFRRKRLWDEWVDYLELPRAALPRPAPTLHDYGALLLEDGRGRRAAVPVCAMISDQQAALFGYDCRQVGQAACTHGTASFVNVCAGGHAPPPSRAKTYLAWELDGAPTYSLEADTTVTGAVIRWMQEQMGWLSAPADLGPLALSVPDAAGVAFVPAFTGLGVPSEDRTARGTILGMTLDTGPAHLARAFLESIGYQLRDILDAIAADTGLLIDQLHVGGGISASDAACQIQADVLGLPVVRTQNAETSARAAALLAGLGAGLWPDAAALPRLGGEEHVFEPKQSPEQRAEGLGHWRRAAERARGWAGEH